MATRRETAKHLEAFEAWYAASRNFRKISENLGIKSSTLYDWADNFDWHERADARDNEAKRIADEEAARERAKRQKLRRQAGELLAARGREYFAKNAIDSPRDAIQAIKYGTEIERKEDGIPDWVLMILNANEDDLKAMAQHVGQSLTAGETAGEDAGGLSAEPDAEDD